MLEGFRELVAMSAIEGGDAHPRAANHGLWGLELGELFKGSFVDCGLIICTEYMLAK